MASEGENVDNWSDAYVRLRPVYKQFVVKLKALIADLLDVSSLDYIQIEGRAKSLTSFNEKIQRKGSKYDDPLREITDLAGLRIITYYVEDVQTVTNILREEFSIIESLSIDKSGTLDHDRFGYTSVHLVACLSKSRGALPEWRQYRELRVEFQVRTALQHAWAAVSHKLDYKRTVETPRPLRRQLFRLSALFELADEQFSALRDSSIALAEAYVEDVREGHLKISADRDSVDVYMKNSPTVMHLLEIATQTGWEIVDQRHVGERRARQDRDDLLRILRQFDMSSIEDLDQTFSDVQRMKLILTLLADPEIAHGRATGTADDILTQVLMAHRNVSEEVFKSVYASANWNGFHLVLSQLHE